MQPRILQKVNPGCHNGLKHITSTFDDFQQLSKANSQHTSPQQHQQLGKLCPSVDLDLLLSLDHQLLARVYCLSNTKICQEFTEDPDYTSHTESSQINRLVSLMQKLLSLKFWNNQQEVMSAGQTISQVIGRIQTFQSQRVQKPTFHLYLQQISKIFGQNSEQPQQPNKMDEERSSPNGIYSFLEHVSGFGDTKPIYFAQLDVIYETREFQIRWNGCHKMKVCVRSSKMFMDWKLKDLAKCVEQEQDEYQDYLYFDLASKYEIPLSTRLRDLQINDLAVSEIVTNLAPADEPLTIKFSFDRDSRIFFLLTFAHGKWYPSVAKQARKKISQLLGVPEHLSFTLRYNKNEESLKQQASLIDQQTSWTSTQTRPGLAKRVHDKPHANSSKSGVKLGRQASLKRELLGNIFREFDEAVDLFKLIFMNQADIMGTTKYTEVFFDLPVEETKRICVAPQKVIHFRPKITPAQVFEEFYRSKLPKPVSPSTSAQILIVEYSAKCGLAPPEMAVDFKSPYLDSCSHQFYQLTGVVIEVLEQKCGTLQIPLVRVGGRTDAQWYSPVHDSHLVSLEGLDIKTYIYERTFDTD